MQQSESLSHPSVHEARRQLFDLCDEYGIVTRPLVDVLEAAIRAESEDAIVKAGAEAGLDVLQFVSKALAEQTRLADRLTARVEALTAALRPFAALLDPAMEARRDINEVYSFNGVAITYGDLRRARALLAEGDTA